MRDRPLILGALALLLALLTWPAWRGLASGPTAPPALARPIGATRCVAPTEFMRASHMKLLEQWRDRVVRDGVRTYRDGDGQLVTMSLSGTCLRTCHTDKTKFCDRCHTYAGVAPTCWNCHVAPSPAARPAAHPGADPPGTSASNAGRDSSPYARVEGLGEQVVPVRGDAHQWGVAR
jgi:hypothetical protein